MTSYDLTVVIPNCVRLTAITGNGLTFYIGYTWEIGEEVVVTGHNIAEVTRDGQFLRNLGTAGALGTGSTAWSDLTYDGNVLYGYHESNGSYLQSRTDYNQTSRKTAG